MAQPGDNEFEALQNLLALKRHEQPPPGHYDRLADGILERLDGAPDEVPASWWERLIDQTELKLALAGALGLVVVAFYFLGWSWSETLELEANTVPFSSSQPWMAAAQPPLAAEADATAPDVWSPAPVGHSSINPVFGAGVPRDWITPAAFNGIDQFQRVEFKVTPR